MRERPETLHTRAGGDRRCCGLFITMLLVGRQYTTHNAARIVSDYTDTPKKTSARPKKRQELSKLTQVSGEAPKELQFGLRGESRTHGYM
jgi:hypothetical protein